MGYLHSAGEDFNSGQPRKNLMSIQVEGLNPGPLYYKSSTLTTQLGCLLLLQDQKQSLQDLYQLADENLLKGNSRTFVVTQCIRNAG